MIKRNYQTILAIDASINGSGVVLISNDPKYEKNSISEISGSKYFIIMALSTDGVAKNGDTSYKFIAWNGKEIAEFRDKFSIEKEQRSVIVFNNLVKPILEKYQVTKIVIEGYAYAGKGRVFDIAEFTGVLKYLINNHLGFEIKMAIVPPQTLKKYIAENGGAKKEAMSYKIRKKYRVEIPDEDMTDALGLAIMYSELGDTILYYISRKKVKKTRAKKAS